MKRHIITIAVACIALSRPVVASDSAADEKAIRQVVKTRNALE